MNTIYKTADEFAREQERIISTGPDKYNSFVTYRQIVANYIKSLYSGERPMGWCSFSAPFELLTAMGVSPSIVELFAAAFSTLGIIEEYIDEAEHAGYVPEMCTYHRSVLGAILKGHLPEPKFVVATSSPCTSNIAMMEKIARIFKKELFIIQIPQFYSERSIEVLAGQLKDLMDFMALHTGNPVDKEKLYKVVTKTNETRDYLVKIFNLAKHRPSPIVGEELRGLSYALDLLMGTDDALRVVKLYFDDFTDRISRLDRLASDEKLRLLWIQGRIFFKNSIEALLREKYGVVIVAHGLNNIYWEPIDPEDPYRGFAKRMMTYPLHGPIENYIRHLQKMAADYTVDGAICVSIWGCRHGCGSRGLFTDAMKNIGVPVLPLNIDCVDKRNFSEGQIMTRFEAFIEMIGNS